MLLRGGFTDSHHLNVEGQGFAGQGMVQVEGHFILIDDVNPDRYLPPLLRAQHQELAHFGFHSGGNIRLLLFPLETPFILNE